MSYKSITAEEYKQTFKKAQSLIKTAPEAPYLDVHELAHQATEAHFKNPTLPLQTLVKELVHADFSCNLFWAEIQLKVQNPKAEVVDTFSRAEAALDLQRLYLLVKAYLSDEEKLLYQKIGSIEELTDDENLLLEALGVRIRKVLDATTSTKKFYHYYKVYPRGRGQAFAWQTHQKSRPASSDAHSSGDRRSSFRFSN